MEEFKWYVKNELEVPPEIQEQYNAIFGITSPQVAEYSNKIAEAATYDEAYALVMELAEIDEGAAMEALLAWEKEHGELVPNRYYDKASNAGYKFDMKQLS